MKKEIMNLITSSEGQFRINNISYLKRWTKDGMGEDVDKLTLEFDNINNVCFSIYDQEIKSRDYDGIIRECQELTKRFMQEVERELLNNISVGYRNKE